MYKRLERENALNQTVAIKINRYLETREHFDKEKIQILLNE